MLSLRLDLGVTWDVPVDSSLFLRTVWENASLQWVRTVWGSGETRYFCCCSRTCCLKAEQVKPKINAVNWGKNDGKYREGKIFLWDYYGKRLMCYYVNERQPSDVFQSRESERENFLHMSANIFKKSSRIVLLSLSLSQYVCVIRCGLSSPYRKISIFHFCRALSSHFLSIGKWLMTGEREKFCHGRLSTLEKKGDEFS